MGNQTGQQVPCPFPMETPAITQDCGRAGQSSLPEDTNEEGQNTDTGKAQGARGSAVGRPGRSVLGNAGGLVERPGQCEGSRQG